MSLSSFPTKVSLAPVLGAIDDIVALKGANWEWKTPPR
jgi:hypothetical protein